MKLVQQVAGYQIGPAPLIRRVHQDGEVDRVAVGVDEVHDALTRNRCSPPLVSLGHLTFHPASLCQLHENNRRSPARASNKFTLHPKTPLDCFMLLLRCRGRFPPHAWIAPGQGPDYQSFAILRYAPKREGFPPRLLLELSCLAAESKKS